MQRFFPRITIWVGFLMLCLLSQASAFAQNSAANIEFKSKNFSGRETEFEKAKAAYEKGDYYFLRGPVYYPQALENYLVAQKFNPDNADLNYQIGLCYLSLQKDRLKALPYLERAKSLSNSFSNDFLMALGNAYQYNLEFEKAIIIFNAIIDPHSDNVKPSVQMVADAKKHVEECKSGIELIKKPVRVRIENLGPGINTSFPEYAPILSENESKMLFTSRRDNTTGKMVDPVDSLFFEDIYITYKIDNQWVEAQNVGKPINTEDHDATINLSPDGRKLLIYRITNGGDIYESQLNGIQWSSPIPLEGINSKWYENHASYSPDNRKLYFISDRKDSSGIGNKDIYVADITPEGKYENVRNAGPVLNTIYDEDGIYCHPDGKTLFFSSKGHNSMGGYDIFKSTLENGEWGRPVNMGYPINSPDDDVFFVPSADNKRAYFASYREEGYGDKDIYMMSFLNDVEEMSSLFFSISDEEKNNKKKAIVEIHNLKTGALVATRLAENGETVANLPVGNTYAISVTSEGYQLYTDIIEIPVDAANQVISREITLSKDNQTTVRGQITDRDTKVPLAGEVEFQDPSTREIVKTTYSRRDGKYEVRLPAGHDYLVQVRAKGYGTSSDSLLVIISKNDTLIQQSFNLTPIDRKLMSTLKGNVYDLATGKPVTGKVEVVEYGGIPMLVYNKPGKYDCIIFNGASLTITALAEGYLPYSSRLQIDTAVKKLDIAFDIPMIKIEKGSKMVLNNIFFDFNKTTLRPVSYKTLNNLITVLKNYPNISIEISGHTDNVGSMAYNQRLSEGRARVVESYLIRNGIASARLKSVGYSFKQPISSNDTPKGRQLNRRTEIRITSVK